MDRRQLRGMAEEFKPLSWEIDLESDSETETERSSNSIKRKNTQSSPELPSEVAPEADTESKYFKRSSLSREFYDGSDNYRSRLNEWFVNSQRRDSKLPDNDDSPRTHPLYQKATPDADGLYHCPWEDDSCCNHKPEKLKCNYDKFLDSHLKPYRCKVAECENARFSSTACLLRHEREAHAMHGHGEKPFLCTVDGCERGVPGQGFPRHWNLCDHMKRVHNRSPSPITASRKTPKSSRKRNSSLERMISNMHPVATKSRPVQKAGTPVRVLSPDEKYRHGRHQLLSELMEVPSYGDVEGMREQIKKATSYLKLMVSATQEMTSMSLKVPGRERSKPRLITGNRYKTTKVEEEIKTEKRYQATVEDDDE